MKEILMNMKLVLTISLLITSIVVYAMENQQDKNLTELIQKSKKRTIENFDCTLCTIGNFKDEVALAKHHQKVHGIKIDYKALKKRKNLVDLYCKICEKDVPECKYEGQLNFHLENKHQVCHLCFQKCASSPELSAHIFSKHPEQIKPLIFEE